MEEYTLKKVLKLLDYPENHPKKLHIHALRRAELSQFKSPVWFSGIWHMIYNRHNELVRSFYACTKCRLVYHIPQTGQGNSKLTRHPCYKKWLIKNGTKKANNDSDSSNETDTDNETGDSDDEEAVSKQKPLVKLVNQDGPSSEQQRILTLAFDAFRAACWEPYRRNEDNFLPIFGELMPRTWRESEW